MVGYICYCGTELWDKRKSRPGRVLRRMIHVIPSEPIKDCTVVGSSDKIEHMPIT